MQKTKPTRIDWAQIGSLSRAWRDTRNSRRLVRKILAFARKLRQFSRGVMKLMLKSFAWIYVSPAFAAAVQSGHHLAITKLSARALAGKVARH